MRYRNVRRVYVVWTSTYSVRTCVAPPIQALSTMSNPAVVFNHDPRFPKDNPASHDDMSDVTLPHGKNDISNDPALTSKVLKFSFVYSGTTHHQVAPSIIHTHWIQAVQ